MSVTDRQLTQRMRRFAPLLQADPGGGGGGGGSGTVTSVAASGGTTGFSFTGGPVTTIGTLTLTIGNAATIRTEIGLGNVNNTSDANKPVSTAQQTALDLKANLASPTFIGTPSAPTPAAATNSTQLATTAFVQTLVANLIASAPGLLDTLDEIAAALGDDPNFAATMTTALAGKQPIDATLTALAGLAGGSDKLAYFTGVDVLAQATFTAFARTLLDDADATTALSTLGLTADGKSLVTAANYAAMRTLLSLGTAALQNTGTSGANIPFLNGTNTWGGNQSFTGRLLPTQTGAAAATLHIVNDFYMQALFESSSSAGGFGMKNSAGQQYEFQCDPGNRLIWYDRTQAEYRFLLTNGGLLTLPATGSSTDLGYKLGVGGTGYFSGDLRLASNLLIQDSDDSHYTTVSFSSNLTANRALTITTGDADRTLTLAGNATISNTNSGDQTSIVGITGTLAQFNTAITDADIPNLTSVTGLAGAIGPAIADYFSTTLSLDAASSYEITGQAYFLKTTAGTVLFTWTFSSAPTMASSRIQMTPATGFTTSTITGAEQFLEATAQAVAAMAHAASASLTTAVYHSAMFTLLVRTNAATTLQLRVTSSAGTVTPQAGSFMSARKVA